jgi:hypothetical protein
VLIGDDGDDVLYAGGGNDVLNGGSGADTENGERGSDTADYSSGPSAIVADLQAGHASGDGGDLVPSIEGLIGSPKDDVLRGSSARNTLDGRRGIDLIFGRSGGDALLGGPDADYLKGEEGDDRLGGGAGVDSCDQGPGTGPHTSCFGRTWPDPNDNPGPLDVGRVIVRPSHRMGWTIRTHSRWTPLSIWDHGYFLVLLDTAGTDQPEYHVLVRSHRDHLSALLFHGNKVATSLTVSRPDGHSVKVSVPIGTLRFGAGHPWFGWQVETIFDGPGCPPCFDLVADGGAAVQARR